MVSPKQTCTLQITGVSKRFGHRQVLSDVHFSCETGQVVGLLGRNGSGKSTLLKIIFGSEQADGRRVTIDSLQIEKPFQRRLIAYMPQDGFLPRGYRLKHLVRTILSDKIAEKAFWSNPRAAQHRNAKMGELSFGIRRYCEVLLTLHLPAPFILLDEPFSDVEPLIREEIKELLSLHSLEKGIIATDHDFEALLEVADQTYLLQNGRCHAIKNRQELIDRHYLPSPEPKTASPHQEQDFVADQQTRYDLGMQPSSTDSGLFDMFEQPETKGGKHELMEILQQPLKEKNLLERRSEVIRFFQDNDYPLTVDRRRMDFISYYLDSGVIVGQASTLSSIIASMSNWRKASNDYYIKKEGISGTYEWLLDLETTFQLLLKLEPPPGLANAVILALDTIQGPVIRRFLGQYESRPLYLAIEQHDHLLRRQAIQELRSLLALFYYYEALQAIARTAGTKGLEYPEYLSGPQPQINVQGLFHPLLEKPVGNDFELNDENICFLTGANMSGKSTFLKALGVAVYFAHLGLPVPARSMSLTLFDGLYTTINLSDNLTLGLSHFYHEVTRVKEVGQRLQQGDRLVVIFDEIFRGTNVRDARRASREIISAFGEFSNSLFIVSSHILEIASDIEGNDNVMFRCFETELVGDDPVYNYQLAEGVCRDSLGWNILQKEGVLTLLKKANDTHGES